MVFRIAFRTVFRMVFRIAFRTVFRMVFRIVIGNGQERARYGDAREYESIWAPVDDNGLHCQSAQPARAKPPVRHDDGISGRGLAVGARWPGLPLPASRMRPAQWMPTLCRQAK